MKTLITVIRRRSSHFIHFWRERYKETGGRDTRKTDNKVQHTDNTSPSFKICTLNKYAPYENFKKKSLLPS
jgi:hypothetical protein